MASSTPTYSYQWTNAEGGVEFAEHPPSDVPLDQIVRKTHNARGTIISYKNLQNIADDAAARQAMRDELDAADEEYAAAVDDAKLECEAELGDANRQRMSDARSEHSAAAKRAREAPAATRRAAGELDSALTTNNRARSAQNIFSEGVGLGGNFLGPAGNVGAGVVSSLTGVPTLATSPQNGLPDGVNSAAGAQRAVTGGLVNGAGGADALRGGFSDAARGLGAFSKYSDAKSVVSLFKGPEHYEMLGNASIEQLDWVSSQLEGADLAFAEELFGYDSEELQAYIEELKAARQAELDATSDEERAKRREEYIALLNKNLRGTCIAQKSAPAMEARNERRSAAAAQLDAQLDANAAQYDRRGNKI